MKHILLDNQLQLAQDDVTISLPTPSFNFGANPPWFLRNTTEIEIQRAKKSTIEEYNRYIREVALGFTASVYSAPLQMSAAIPAGHYAISEFGHVIVNEEEASGKAQDSDGDMIALKCSDLGTNGALPIKYPITSRPEWLKAFQEQIVETFHDFTPSFIPEPYRVADVKQAFLDAHADPQTGTKTKKADGRDLFVINQKGLRGTAAHAYLGTDTRRYLEIEGGMKSVRGDKSIARQESESGDPYSYSIDPMWETVLFNSSRRPVNLMPVSVQNIKKSLSRLNVPVDQYVPESKPVRDINTTPSTFRHDLLSNLTKLGALVLIEIPHIDPFLGSAMIVRLVNEFNQPVALTSTKRGKYHEVNYGFVMLPEIRVELFWQHGDQLVPNHLVVRKGDRYFVEVDKYLQEVSNPHYSHRVVSPIELLDEALSTVWVGRNWRTAGSTWESVSELGSQIVKTLSKTVGRNGYQVRVDDKPLIENGTIRDIASYNPLTIDMSKLSVQINFGTMDEPRRFLSMNSVLQWYRANSEFDIAFLGGDKGKFRLQQTYGIAKRGDLRPLWAPAGTCPKRTGELKSQLANAFSLGIAYVLICNSDTKGQMWATPKGVEKQTIPNIFLPQIVHPDSMLEENADMYPYTYQGFGDSKTVYLTDPKKTARTGKIITRYGTKNMVAPIHEIIVDTGSELVEVDYVMSYHEFEAKKCLNAITQDLVAWVDAELHGQTVKCMLVEIDVYRTSAHSENITPGQTVRRFSKMSGLIIKSALGTATKGTDIQEDGYGLHDPEYLEALKAYYRALENIPVSAKPNLG